MDQFQTTRMARQDLWDERFEVDLAKSQMIILSRTLSTQELLGVTAAAIATLHTSTSFRPTLVREASCNGVSVIGLSSRMPGEDMVVLNVNDMAQIAPADRWNRLLVAAEDHVTKGRVAACHPDPEAPARIVKAFADLLEVALRSMSNSQPTVGTPDTSTRS